MVNVARYLLGFIYYLVRPKAHFIITENIIKSSSDSAQILLRSLLQLFVPLPLPFPLILIYFLTVTKKESKSILIPKSEEIRTELRRDSQYYYMRGRSGG